MKMPNQKVRSQLMQILNRVDIEQILWISFSPDNNKRFYVFPFYHNCGNNDNMFFLGKM